MNLIGIFKKVLRNGLCESKQAGRETEPHSLESENSLNFGDFRLFSDDPNDFRNPSDVFTNPAYDFMYCNIHYRGSDEN